MFFAVTACSRGDDVLVAVRPGRVAGVGVDAIDATRWTRVSRRGDGVRAVPDAVDARSRTRHVTRRVRRAVERGNERLEINTSIGRLALDDGRQ